jgi:hypothetical protein
MENDSYLIPIEGRWTLEDLYEFPRAYEQCYFAYLGLSPEASKFEDDRVLRAFEAFPWQGGYSAVDFYNQLKWAVPKRGRPRINRIEYASPGLIELGGLVVSIAVIIEKVVHTLCNAAKDVNRTYSAIHRDMQKRKLLRIRTESEIRKLTPGEQRVVDGYAEEMAGVLDVDLSLLNKRTGASYKSLKIMLSLFRRLRQIAKFQKGGKVNLGGRVGSEK